MIYPIPEEAFEAHIGIVGKTGSGKTVSAKGAAERLLRKKKRLCALDPTGVWSGLRSSGDGKSAGFPVIVLGGDNGDLPLLPESGAAIAAVIAASEDSFVLDTSNMTDRGQTKFSIDFAEEIRRLNRDPLYLFIDECQNFMPQGKISDPESARMVRAWNRLIAEGRSRGLCITMISQRPAKVHKDSLTQIETLVAMRLTSPQDRDAIEGWMGERRNKEASNEILDSLPSLPTGEGWIWAPEIGMRKRAKFPMISTYDSSKAPDGQRGKAVLAKVDLQALETLMKEKATEVIENDPVRLKARIRELERAKAPAPTVSIDKKATEEAYSKGRRIGHEEGYSSGRNVVLSKIDEFLAKHRTNTTANIKLDLVSGVRRAAAHGGRKHALPIPPAPPAPRTGDADYQRSPEGMTKPFQKILDACAMLETLGVRNIKKGHVAAFAHVRPTSGGFFNNLGKLRAMGLIDYPAGGEVALTDLGRKTAQYPTAPVILDDLHKAWLDIVPTPQRTILEALIDQYPEPVPKDALAEKIGVSPTSGGYFNNLGKLRSLGVIDYPSKGTVCAADILFPEGL